MRTRIVLIVFAAILLGTCAAGGVAAEEDNVTIDRIAPNPVPNENLGEYVVLHANGSRNLSGVTITDGTDVAQLPNRSIEGRVAFSAHPRLTTLLTNTSVDGWSGHFPMSVDGETLRLRDANGDVLDEATYDRTGEGTEWKRTGPETLVPTHGGPVPGPFPTRSVDNATPIILPDSPEAVIDLLRGAERRLWLAGYEFTDPATARLLAARHDAGVDVRVLLDGSPVGGQAVAETAALDRTASAGVPISVLTGDRRRFSFHHPKYAIVDDTAIVLSENWKPNGVGGTSSRGWGIAVHDAAVADDLATVFDTDETWRDRRPWTSRTSDPPPANTPTPLPIDNHEPRTLPTDHAELAIAPSTAMERVDALLANATESIRIQQVRIGSRSFPLLDRALQAADRGVDVQIQLDSSQYVADENAAMVDRLRALADREDLPLAVERTEGGSRFEKIHNKGVIVDEETVVVGSMNWNNASATENREVIVIVEGEDIASYYADVFDADVSPPTGTMPVGFVASVIGIWILGGIVASRRVAFGTI